MNYDWSAVAAICSCFGVLITIMGVAYTSGRLTEKIRENREKLDNHTKILVLHAEKLSEHDIQLGELKAYQSGYNAAVSLGARSKE